MDVVERYVDIVGLLIHQHHVSVRESAPPNVLAADSYVVT